MNDNPRNPDQWTQTSSPGAEVSLYSHEVQAATNEAMRQARPINDTSSEGPVGQSSVAWGLTRRAERLALPVGNSGEQEKKLKEILTLGLLLVGMRKNATNLRPGVPR